jgi:hypothetical protein
MFLLNVIFAKKTDKILAENRNINISFAANIDRMFVAKSAQRRSISDLSPTRRRPDKF